MLDNTVNSPFKQQSLGWVHVTLPVLKQGQSGQDVSLVLLSGSHSQGTFIGFSWNITICSMSLWHNNTWTIPDYCASPTPYHWCSLQWVLPCSRPEPAQLDHWAPAAEWNYTQTLPHPTGPRCCKRHSGTYNDVVWGIWKALSKCMIMRQQDVTIKLCHNCLRQKPALLWRTWTEAVQQLWGNRVEI